LINPKLGAGHLALLPTLFTAAGHFTSHISTSIIIIYP